MALRNGDGPIEMRDEPYPGPEGRWNVIFAKPQPVEVPPNVEVKPVTWRLAFEMRDIST